MFNFFLGGKTFLSQLNGDGLKKRIQKTDMSSTVLSTTTEIGLPVRLQIRSPWVLQGKTNMNLINWSTLNMTFALKYVIEEYISFLYQGIIRYPLL